MVTQGPVDSVGGFPTRPEERDSAAAEGKADARFVPRRVISLSHSPPVIYDERALDGTGGEREYGGDLSLFSSFPPPCVRKKTSQGVINKGSRGNEGQGGGAPVHYIKTLRSCSSLPPGRWISRHYRKFTFTNQSTIGVRVSNQVWGVLSGFQPISLPPAVTANQFHGPWKQARETIVAIHRFS